MYGLKDFESCMDHESGKKTSFNEWDWLCILDVIRVFWDGNYLVFFYGVNT